MSPQETKAAPYLANCQDSDLLLIEFPNTTDVGTSTSSNGNTVFSTVITFSQLKTGITGMLRYLQAPFLSFAYDNGVIRNQNRTVNNVCGYGGSAVIKIYSLKALLNN